MFYYVISSYVIVYYIISCFIILGNIIPIYKPMMTHVTSPLSYHPPNHVISQRYYPYLTL